MNKLDKVLEQHSLWLKGEGGKRTNLSGADLSDANLSRTNLSQTNLSGVDLFRANLTRANLREANLREANLFGVVGNMKEIKSGQLDHWPFAYTAEVLQIGCENHPISDWWEFTDEEIDAMHVNALGWWRKWKPILKQIIETSPAEPTGVER